MTTISEIIEGRIQAMAETQARKDAEALDADLRQMLGKYALGMIYVENIAATVRRTFIAGRTEFWVDQAQQGVAGRLLDLCAYGRSDEQD